MSEQDHEHAGPAAGRSVTRQRRLAEEHHARTLWASYTLLLIGVWLLLAPLAGIDDPRPTLGAERGGWGSIATRVALMRWNDVLCGAVLVLAAWRSLEPHRAWARRVACGVGVWLGLAPVLLAAPSASGYANDTFVGMAVVALSALVLGATEGGLFAPSSGAVPRGWTYDPSSWPQRVVIIVVSFGAFLASRALAAFQLGYDDRIAEPLFARQGPALTDAAARSLWPISDAGLAAFVLTLVFLVAFRGGPARWRTAPWAALLQSALAIPAGVALVVITLAHHAATGGWSTLRLVAAGLGAALIALQSDELVAAWQHLARASRRGQPLGVTLWRGTEIDGERDDVRTPDLAEARARPGEALRAATRGASVSWSLGASMLASALVMMLPALTRTAGPAAHVLAIAGGLAIVIAVIASAEVTRLARYANVVTGAVIAIAPLALGGAPLVARALAVVLGCAVALLALPRARRTERYGAWDRFVR